MVGADQDDIRSYLTGIGMGAPLVERTETVLTTITSFLPETPKFIFVSDFRDEEGNRTYSSLWVLTETFISEAQQFVTEGKFDFIRNDCGLSHLLVDHDEFDFKVPRDNSRLSVMVSFAVATISGTFRASGSNCADLQQIMTDYLLPLLTNRGG